jgi:hypothetical protein
MFCDALSVEEMTAVQEFGDVFLIEGQEANRAIKIISLLLFFSLLSLECVRS